MIQKHKVIVEHNVPSPIRKTTSLGASTKAHDLVMKNEEVSGASAVGLPLEAIDELVPGA
jgi:hypothetical protein